MKTPNQAAGANVGERRSAACCNRGSVAALPAMAQLFRSTTFDAAPGLMNRKALLVLLITGFLSSPAVLTSQGAEPRSKFKLQDVPPSPFDAKLSTNTSPEADPILQALEKEVARHAASTNQAAVDLIAEAKELTSKLLALQKAVEANNPLLRVYGRYVEKAHDWVMTTHGREFWEANRYFSSTPADPAKQRTQHDLIALIDMALYKQLANNTNFAPLLKSVFGALEHKVPGQFAASYARNDALMGFHPEKSPGPVTTFEAYLTELDRRYDLVLAKLTEIQRQEDIPTDVIVGWMYGDLYRLLDGSAQQYVMLSTPQELESLRQQLRRKLIQSSNLDAPAQ